MKKSKINLADYVKMENKIDGRVGYLKESNEFGYYDQAHKLVDQYGNELPYRFLPYYEGKLATKEEVIYLGKGEDGWVDLIEVYNQFEKKGKSFTYHTFVPCAGYTVKVEQGTDGVGVIVNGEEFTHPIISLRQAFEASSRLPIPVAAFSLEERYFLEAYKGLEEDDYDGYFSLITRGGVSDAIKVAENNHHTEITEILQSWVACGMTDEESRRVWLDSTISSCYDHSYYWRGVEVCFESYGLNCPRHKTICSVTPERIAEVRAQEAAEEQSQKEARKNKFEEALAKASEVCSETVINLALRQKGKVIGTLLVLASGEESLTDDELITAMKATKSQSSDVLANLLAVIKVNPRTQKVQKVVQRAYAWVYLRDALSEIAFTGYFDEAIEALRIYCDKGFESTEDRLVYS